MHYVRPRLATTHSSLYETLIQLVQLVSLALEFAGIFPELNLDSFVSGGGTRVSKQWIPVNGWQ
ncbi:hypothetical protein CHELA40_14899 [Chelatococcus asaccharovorans]|nr:hypothetical protein CHELA17_60723 [Chelatococcus asaccharovorans]CAH1680639.1 hypothetical protein CHELA40_14899 [Chelatococcus asaccharovorans]